MAEVVQIETVRITSQLWLGVKAWVVTVVSVELELQVGMVTVEKAWEATVEETEARVGATMGNRTWVESLGESKKICTEKMVKIVTEVPMEERQD